MIDELLELVRSNAWTVDDGPVVDTSEIIVILNIFHRLVELDVSIQPN